MEELKGGKEWVERIEAFDPAVRHIHNHEGHLTFVNGIDRDIITGDLIEKYTFSGEADALRAKIKELEAIGVTEIAFQPAGPDIPRELRSSLRWPASATRTVSQRHDDRHSRNLESARE
jgi:5,10-methylenetetrahydromethanopterin reductase